MDRLNDSSARHPPTAADGLPSIARRPTTRPTTPWSSASTTRTPPPPGGLPGDRQNQRPAAADVIVTGLQVDKLTDDYLADGTGPRP